MIINERLTGNRSLRNGTSLAPRRLFDAVWMITDSLKYVPSVNTNERRWKIERRQKALTLVLATQKVPRGPESKADEDRGDHSRGDHYAGHPARRVAVVALVRAASRCQQDQKHQLRRRAATGRDGTHLRLAHNPGFGHHRYWTASPRCWVSARIPGSEKDGETPASRHAAER